MYRVYVYVRVRVKKKDGGMGGPKREAADSGRCTSRPTKALTLLDMCTSRSVMVYMIMPFSGTARSSSMVEPSSLWRTTSMYSRFKGVRRMGLSSPLSLACSMP